MNDLEEMMQRQTVPISVRFSTQEIETLDRLVIACRAFYEKQPAPFSRMANEVTRSSAIRDLLLAWDHGCCDQFSRTLAKKVR